MKKNDSSKKTDAKGKRKIDDGLRVRKGKPFKEPIPSTKQQKRKKASDADSIPPEIAASLLAGDSAPDFPRGGGNALSRSEKIQARKEAEQEFEREENEPKGRKEKEKKHKRSVRSSGSGWEDEWTSLFGEGVSAKLPRFANRITLKNISPNMKILGVVSEVNTDDIVISLPGGLKGIVHPKDASDIFSDNRYKDLGSNYHCSIFNVGQLVPCVVTEIIADKKEGRGSKKILLSLCLSVLHKGLALDNIQDELILNAYVQNIEDHGYILSFGLSSFSGFLPKHSQGGTEITLKVGQLVQGVVKSIDKAHNVVFLNSDIESISKNTLKDFKGLSVDALLPGMMVNARVRAVLENGILLSFLTYFTGTVDIFHMQSIFPGKSWKDDYHQNKKVNARILFVDPYSRAVGLTLNAHLIHNRSPPQYVKVGDIFDNARIVRVDKGVGLLLELPSIPDVSPAYISRSETCEKEIDRLDKKFKEDSCVRVRVLGFRHIEGISVGTLKASAFEGSIFTHSDVEPGMLAKAKVIAVGSFGAIVQFPSGVKGLCPISHMSEFGIAKPPKKFVIGAELLFRVLGCKLKRLTLTYKKTLVKSKLKIVASYTDATEGLITHGWISKIEKHGCFVKFYNGIHGFARSAELGLEPGSQPHAEYHVGQVIKCRIISADPASRRIDLSFNMSPKRVAEGVHAQVGSLVCGVVERLTSDSVTVEVGIGSYRKGIILNEQLADHQGQALLLKSLLKPGYMFDQLLVLDDDGRKLILSAKHSLIISSGEIPLDIARLQPDSLVHGYICNLIDTGCFVRFLGHLTGFSPLHKVADEHIENPSDAFYVGQSVRSRIVNVNSDTNRITISLKQSCCFSTDASLIQGYFLLDEKMAELQALATGNPSPSAMKSLRVGLLVEGEVLEKKEYGVVVSLKGHGDAIGFATNYHLGGKNVEKGSSVKALVLDKSESEGVVDLSLKSEFFGGVTEKETKISTTKKKRQRDAFMDLELHGTVNAVVEIVKENYLVLSIPENNYKIGFASTFDYNTQMFPRRSFVEGQSVLATIVAIPSSKSGRLLLLLNSLNEASKMPSKRAKRRSTYSVGSLVQAEITDVKSLELFCKIGDKTRGRIHITEVTDDKHPMDYPLLDYRIGQVLPARIVAKAQKFGKGYDWELSLRPSFLPANGESWEACFAVEKFDFSIGQAVGGYVTKVEEEWLYITISRSVRAQLYILDSSSDPTELLDFKKRYSVGDAVSGHIICLNKEKKLLRLSPRLLEVEKVKIVKKENAGSNFSYAEHILEGDIVGGRIKRILPGVAGILVQIGPHLYGKAHYTELSDQWIANPLSDYEEGMYVKCKILEVSHSSGGVMHVDLSVLSSTSCINSHHSPGSGNGSVTEPVRRIEKINDLHPDMLVKGYVKNITEKGCFIMLSRKIDARILLSNLSDGFIEKPEEEYPVGKLVQGRVISVEPRSGRVDVTLKSENRASKSDIFDFSNLHVGDIITGSVKRIESYGLFITIDHTNVVGLCHISNLSATPIEKIEIESKYGAGDRVQAKILKVDQERQRISLGMKNLESTNDDFQTEPTSNFDYVPDGDVSSIDKLHGIQPTLDLSKIQDAIGGQVLPPERSFVPPLDVKLDDMSISDSDNSLDEENHIHVNDTKAENSKRLSKKRDKERRELVISASEDRLLENDIPKTADEFEKLVRGSPNSSFLWIKYMAFLLSLADIEKARLVAERALRTISIREENEKLNVWVAYFNLENEYGSPREDAVKRIFGRALQYCDPKKLHLALLGIYERSEQHKFVDELLEKMTKKFRNSCKVWLHYVQSLLKRNKDKVHGVIKRALLSLSRNKHIKFISQAAILEFKCDLPDMGRSLFEGILREYPKRTDLWSIYLDQEIRLGDIEVTRALFDRATCLSLPPKKMKKSFMKKMAKQHYLLFYEDILGIFDEFLLKRYLEYEKSIGDEKRIDYVTQKALEYANNL